MFENVIIWLLGLLLGALLLLLGWVGWSAWQDSKRPTFDLNRDDWTCSRSESRTRLRPTVAGKTTTLIPVTENVCMEYRRLAG